MKPNPLSNIVKDQKSGKNTGLYSICSANRFVIEASILQAIKDNSTLCIEATSNQVDQFGGYTGMKPADFAAFVTNMAKELGFPAKKLILGGDHLGPNTWRNENSGSAMQKARVLMAAYVKAGFSKLHLDASMKCSDDSGEAPAPRVAAERAAELCAAAEAAWDKSADTLPAYIVGTEVPPPGGAALGHGKIHITCAAGVAETVKEIQNAFKRKGLQSAWDRVQAVVVQPGVEFGDSSVDTYVPENAAGLKTFIENQPNIIFEAHSTDYQPGSALKELVRDHFAVLKVGPWLTFAFREALFSLEKIEAELFPGKSVKLSELENTLESVMLKNTSYWKNYYNGTESEVADKRKYSYSDRCRYYWHLPELELAISLLLNNLSGVKIPLPLIERYLPAQADNVKMGSLSSGPRPLIHAKIMEVTSLYSKACGFSR